MSANDYIQRFPQPSGRWRGLSSQELTDILTALEAAWRGEAYQGPRIPIKTLLDDLDAEITRRETGGAA